MTLKPPAIVSHLPRFEVPVVVGLFLAACTTVLAAVLILNRGQLSYTVDDAYIHLAVAEEIARGHYGVNPVEFSAPCSSPLWPVLLAPLARTALGDWLPLLANTACGALAALLIIRRLIVMLPGPAPALAAARIALALVVVLSCNLVTLVFTGMEHCLQVLAAIAVVDGMLAMGTRAKPAAWFWLALAIGPLVRYENLPLTLAGCAMAALCGHWRPALAAGTACLAGLLAFSAFLHSLGLPPVPASITVKTATPYGRSLLERGLAGIEDSYWNERGRWLLYMTGALAIFGLVVAAAGRLRDRRAWAAGAVCLAALAHAAFGKYGYYQRYEPYIIGALVFALFALAGGVIVRRLPRHAPLALVPMIVVAAAEIVPPYAASIINSPVGANNIFEQQFQMHRFAVGWWRRPIAVNDLGWVSYRNDRHVVDLWGLASLEAFHARVPWKGPAWMDTLAGKYDVGLAIIYDEWFSERPAGWIKLAEMTLSRECLTPSHPRVCFYATGPQHLAGALAALESFRPSLPAGVRLDILAAQPASTASLSPPPAGARPAAPR